MVHTMTEINAETAEKTYRAIGRFMFEFTIRCHRAEEIHLDDRYFTAIVGSYDVALLCSVTKAIVRQSRPEKQASSIEKLLN